MSEELRVWVTGPYAWPHVRRGSEAVLHGLASWLRRRGVPVEILAGGPRADKYEVDGVPVELVRARDLTRIHRDLDAEATMIPAMARRLRASHPDVVHAFHYADGVAARASRQRYLVSFEGIVLPRSFAGRPLRRWLFHRGLRGAAVIVCPSRATARHLADSYGFRSEIIPNGLDVSRFALDEPRQPGLILCAATADDRRKRLEVLVDAFGLLAARRPDTELALVAGAGPARQQALLHRLSADAQRRVHFLDPPRDELARAYARASVTCLPSLNEAFGMVVVESLAAGTPVVGTDHGAIPELLTEDVGALFPADDVHGCAKALDAVLARGTGSDVVSACRRRASEFDWSSVGPRFVDLYHRIA